MKEEKGTSEIDLLQVIAVLLKRWWIILITSVVCAAAVFGYTYSRITPLYKASALMYVNNSNLSPGSVSISTADLTASKSLVSSYSVILKSRLTLEEVIKRANLKYSYEELNNMVSAASVNDTEIFSITVESPDPDEARIIANTIVEVLPDKISDVINGSSASIVDLAVTPKSSFYPSYGKNTVMGFLIGFVISAAAVVIVEVFVNDRIQSDDWLRNAYGENIPVLSIIPNFSSKNSNKYGGKGKYSYYGGGVKPQNRSAGTEKKL